jgi:RNase P subunit RPR2
MTGRSKLLASKEIRFYIILHQHIIINHYTSSTCLGCAIIERVAMSKRKATEPLGNETKKQNASDDFVYYSAAHHEHRVQKVSAT